VAGVATFLAAALAAWALAPRLPGGDEPHYLVITQSLLLDRDLRIANNHDNRDYAAYFSGVLRPDKIQDGQDGEVYSIHAPGTSALVLPGFAWFGYRGAQATIILTAAVTGAWVWWIGWIATGDRRAAWFAWAAVVLSTTSLVQAVTIFPDGPGALATAVGAATALTLARTDRTVRTRHLVIVGALLAALPWLHTRFAILALTLGGLVAWRLRATDGRSLLARRLIAFLAIPALSAVGWFAYFYVIYGTFNPAAPYGRNPETSLAYIPGGMIGLLFDEQFGLLTYAPALAAAAAGLAWRSRDALSRTTIGLAAAAVVYFAVVGTYWMWWAGVPATPARFAAAALPLFAAPVALGWSRSGPALRAIWNLLLLVSSVLTLTVIAVERGALAWNHRGVPRALWLEWFASAADLARGWPSFFWRLTPGQVDSEIRFAAHVALWLAAFVVAGFLCVRGPVELADRPGRPMLRAAWWLAATVMAAVQCGWWLAPSGGVDAAASQVAMLGRVSAQAPIARIAPFAVRTATETVPAMRIRPSRSDSGIGNAHSWMPLRNVPSGRYTLSVATGRPIGGTIVVKVGRASTIPIALRPLSRQTAFLDLPNGAAFLTFEPDPTLAGTTIALELTPQTLLPGAERITSVRFW
jgi:hypothetical protein